MRLLTLAWKNLRYYLLSTVITSGVAALAVGLVMAIFAIHAQAYRAFTSGAPGYDAVLGARGSPLQLVLNCVFHLETSPGNIPWSLYQSLQNNPSVRRAVPLAMGDNYHGFRIVGTTPEFFSDPPADGLKPRVKPGGRFFDGLRKEAIVGSFAAQQTGLKPGSRLHPYHGLAFDPSAQHAEEYLVVGVLQATNTPIDRVIWIPLEGVLRMEGHVLRATGKEYTPQAGQAIPAEHKELSGVLLELSSPQAGFQLDQLINRQGKVATLAFPIGSIVAQVFHKMGWALEITRLIAYLVMVVAAASILASLYNTLQERQRDFAILRALGWTRLAIFQLLVLESSLIGVLGSVGGYLVYALLVGGAGWFVRKQTGVSLETFLFHPVLLLAPCGLMALAAAAGLIPAWRAYRVPVAEVLG